MSYTSPDEVQRRHLRVFGPELGPVFHELYEEIAWVHDKWREYRALFGTSPEHIDLLEESAGRFFGYVQAVIWEDVLLHISRLTDDPGTGKRTTLTIQRLLSLKADPALATRLGSLIPAAIQASAFARDWRNRLLAHRDLELAVGQSPTALKPASRQLVQTAIDALSAVIVAVYEHYFDGGIDLNVPGGSGDALDLLRVLQDGVSAARAREARFNSGEMTLEDLLPRPAV